MQAFDSNYENIPYYVTEIANQVTAIVVMARRKATPQLWYIERLIHDGVFPPHSSGTVLHNHTSTGELPFFRFKVNYGQLAPHDKSEIFVPTGRQLQSGAGGKCEKYTPEEKPKPRRIYVYSERKKYITRSKK